MILMHGFSQKPFVSFLSLLEPDLLTDISGVESHAEVASGGIMASRNEQ